MLDSLQDFFAKNPIQMESDEVPILVSAIKEMPEDGIMVEWGSGASTLKWALEMGDAQHLISVEHNPAWHDTVSAALVQFPNLRKKTNYHLCRTNGYWDHGYGNLAEENPMGLDNYFCPDDSVFDADVFFIDGVARAVCAQMILHRATKRNAKVFIHDWYRRALWYSWSVNTFPRHERVGTTLCQLFMS